MQVNPICQIIKLINHHTTHFFFFCSMCEDFSLCQACAMNPSTQIHRPDHIFIKLKFKQRRQLPTGCLLKYKKVIPMNSFKVKKLIMTNSFKVKYYLVTHCCMTHHYDQTLCQKSFVEWGFIHSECEITPQCSCSIHHRRHCVSHQVRDLVRFVT